LNMSIIDIIFLLTLLFLAVIPKKNWKLKIIFWLVFSANFAIRINYIHKSHEIKELVRPNEISLGSISIEKEVLQETPNKEETGIYGVRITFKKSKPDEPLGKLQFKVSLPENSESEIVSLTTGGAIAQYGKADLPEKGLKTRILSYIPFSA